MPGRLFLDAAPAAAARAAGQRPAPGMEEAAARADAAPGESFWLLTAAGFREMRWGLIPPGRKNARGRPVMETLVNARSETLFEKTAFEGLRRAALPVSGWYEWTGPPRRKTRWAIRDREAPWLWFAAVWDVWAAPGGREVAQFATVTCEPNVDVAPVHDRMGVLLAPGDLAAWTGDDAAAARALMVPWPDGRLEVSEAPDA